MTSSKLPAVPLLPAAGPAAGRKEQRQPAATPATLSAPSGRGQAFNDRRLDMLKRGERMHVASAKKIADFYGVKVTDIWPVEERTR